jgi:uncharacterized protein with PQ loop repeat
MMYHNIFGWIGAILFTICAVPQVIKTWKSKRVDDLSLMFLLFWLGGEIFTMFYVIVDDTLLGITHFPLYINYFFNAVLVFYLIYAKKYYK